MKKLTLLLAVLLCVSCNKEGTYVRSENAKEDFCIEFLFECDGVKMYRFLDGGDYRYFTVGNGKMVNSYYKTSSNPRIVDMYNDAAIQ